MKTLRFLEGVYFVTLWLYYFTGASSASSCPSEKIPCDDGTCVDRIKWCDVFENVDCSDESDEKYCDETGYFTSSDPNGCRNTHFLCKNGICYPLAASCDGIEDCKDGSDEKQCESKDNSTTTGREESDPPQIYPDSSQRIPDIRQIATPMYSHLDLPTTTEETRINARESHSGPPPTSYYAWHQTLPRPSVPRLSTDYGWPVPTPIPVLPLAIRRTLTNSGSLTNAQEWLMRERKADFGWGRDTSRALVALSLSRPGRFYYEENRIALMKKKLQVLMAVDLIRNSTKVISLSRLSLYINAMLASCQNPRNFHGRDVADELRKRTTAVMQSREKRTFINPLIYLTLCLVNETVDEDFYSLREFLNPRSDEQKYRDMQALSIMAYSCMAEIPRLESVCKEILEDSVKRLISRVGKDGNFGNLYSSALAVQALISANATDRWNYDSSVNYLKLFQRGDGSFGDLLATYYVLPVLAGKSLLQLKHVICNRTGTDDGLSIETVRNSKSPMHYVHYSLYLGDPVQVTKTKTLRVPVNSTFLNIMKFAAEMDLTFRFLQEREGDDISIYSISNIPNDAQRGIYWNMYLNPNRPVSNENGLNESNLQPYNRGVQQFIPRSGEHVVFWYRPNSKRTV